MTKEIVISGIVHDLQETITFPSGFSKRILVVKTEHDKYPQHIPVEFVKDKTEALNVLSIGQQVAVNINIRGNEYNGKYYVSLQGWKFEAGNEPARTPAHSQSEHNKAKANGYAPEPKNLSVPSNRQQPAEEADEDDDIPF